MDSTLIPLRLPAYGSAATSADVSIAALNLRDDDDGALRPVSPSRSLGFSGRVLAIVPRPDGGRSLIIADGTTLLAADVDSLPATPVEIAWLDSQPIAAVPSLDGFTVMTADGPLFVEWDADSAAWSLVGAVPEFPSVSLIAADQVSLSATIPGATLSGSYPHGTGPLSIDDSRALARHCADAYARLDASARGAGFFIQPVIAAYRVLDPDGQVLYRSAPVLVGPDSGFQCVGELSASVTDSARSAVTLSASAFRLALVVPDAITSRWRSRAATIEILASRPVHPVRPASSVDAALAAVSSTQSSLSFNMPGVAGTDAGRAQRVALIAGILDRADSLLEVVASFANPFGGGIGAAGRVVTLARRSPADPAADVAALDRALAVPVTRAVGYRDTTLASISLPHSFSASCVAANGDSILWGDPTPLRFAGYPLPQMAASLADGKWRANIAVEMASGEERVVWSGSGNGRYPATLSPLLSYPSPDALSMTVTIDHPDGSVTRDVLPLTPSPGGAAAYYLHPSLAPWTPSSAVTIYTRPAAVTRRRLLPGRVVSALAASPATPNGVLAVSPAPLAGLAKTPPTGWDRNRAHFYAISAAGVASVWIGADNAVASATNVSSRGTASPDRFTIGGGALWVVPPSANGLLRVTGTTVTAYPCVDGVTALGWNPVRGGELWCRLASGIVAVLSTATSRIAYRSLESVDSFWSSSSALLISTPDGWRDASSETGAPVDAALAVRYRVPKVYAYRYDPAPATPPIRAASLDVETPSFAGDFRVRSAQASPAAPDSALAPFAADFPAALAAVPSDGSRPVSTLSISGALTGPLYARLIAPPAPWLLFTLAATLPTAATLRSLSLIF